jgi:surface antigen
MTYELQGFLKPLIAAAHRRTALFFTVLCAAFVCIGAISACRAQAADTSQLCSGYAACSIDGFTTNGYQTAENESWWQMFAGVNCTNYVAYVESQLYDVAAPDSLLGDGGDWGYNAAALGVPVDNTPTVGSVAVWDMGSGIPQGHVAIVQSVGPHGRYIVVSQSGMWGDTDGFAWQRVDRVGGSWEPWPSSFIHFSGSHMPWMIGRPEHFIGVWAAGAE